MGRWGTDTDDSYMYPNPIKDRLVQRVRVKLHKAKAPAKRPRHQTETEPEIGTVRERLNPVELKNLIRSAILDNPRITPVEIKALLFRETGQNVTTLTASNFKSEFKQTLRFLIDRGVSLKRIKL